MEPTQPVQASPEARGPVIVNQGNGEGNSSGAIAIIIIVLILLIGGAYFWMRNSSEPVITPAPTVENNNQGTATNSETDELNSELDTTSDANIEGDMNGLDSDLSN